MCNGLPDFNNKLFWDEALNYYADSNAQPYADIDGIWEYFKFCLKTQNRFFFQNPLNPVIVDRYKKYIFKLSSERKIYRARIDENEKYSKQCWLAKEYDDLISFNATDFDKDSINLTQRRINQISKNPEYQDFLQRSKESFEGYDSKNSGAPPHDRTKDGRCNPAGVSFLYAANDKHTAVAEIRPFIRDYISIATIQINRDLNLVDFYYEVDKKGIVPHTDLFYQRIRQEFSTIRKNGTPTDYLTTQYLTLLAQNAGFDGIRFRSSLVRKGENYVIFDKNNYTPIASKIYMIPQVKYTLLPILEDEKK